MPSNTTVNLLLLVAVVGVCSFFTPQFKGVYKGQLAQEAKMYWHEFNSLPPYAPGSAACAILPRQAKLVQMNNILEQAQRAHIPLQDKDLKDFTVLGFRETFRAVNVDLGTALVKAMRESEGPAACNAENETLNLRTKKSIGTAIKRLYQLSNLGAPDIGMTPDEADAL